MPSGSENRPASKTGAKSAKAIKAASRKKKGTSAAGKGLPTPRQIPWMTLGAAAVMVTANLPPFGTQGSRIDVSVSALGDATNLLDTKYRDGTVVGGGVRIGYAF